MTALQLVQPAQTSAIVECEATVLAALLMDPRRIDGVADVLQPVHFAEPLFGRMFGLIVDHAARGEPLNGVTLRPYLESDEAYQQMGGATFLANLTASPVALMADTLHGARQIKTFARRREMTAGLRAAIEASADMARPIEEVLSAVEEAVQAATDDAEAIQSVSAAEAIDELLKSLESPTSSVSSQRLPDLDDLLTDMRGGELIIGGGRPGMGKTAAALSYALGAAEKGHGVLFISLEMGAKELVARMASDISFDGRDGAAYGDINSRNPSRRAIQAIYDARKHIEKLPFQIVDRGALTLSQLERLVKRWKRRMSARGQSLDLVVVDYLQLLRGDRRDESRYDLVSEASRRLKAMAKDYDVAVFALAQLNRSVEAREDKRPQLSDLKESGQLEQDADAVIFFYREYYYLQRTPPKPGMEAAHEAALQAADGRLSLICAKKRRGEIGSIDALFAGKYQAVRSGRGIWW